MWVSGQEYAEGYVSGSEVVVVAVIVRDMNRGLAHVIMDVGIIGQ